MNETSIKPDEKLKSSPLYNLSMANKELFHSNFLAWFGNCYKENFKELFDELLDGWPKGLDEFTVEREYKHYDITIVDSEKKPRILIENKVKRVPINKQLEGYREAENNKDCRFILLTITKILHGLEKPKGWQIVTYDQLSQKLANCKISDPYHSGLLKDYCSYIEQFQHLIESFDNEDLYRSSPTDDEQKKELGIFDICGKRKVQILYQRLVAKCKDLIVVNDVEALTDDNIMVGWNYTNLALIEVKLKAKKDHIIIQIQGKQYRHGVEFFDDRIGDRIDSMQSKKKVIFTPNEKGIQYLTKTYPDLLDLNWKDRNPRKDYPIHTPFGQRNKYCKYCNGETKNNRIGCFVYQWVEIPQNTSCDELVDYIFNDILNIKKNIKKWCSTQQTI